MDEQFCFSVCHASHYAFQATELLLSIKGMVIGSMTFGFSEIFIGISIIENLGV